MSCAFTFGSAGDFIAVAQTISQITTALSSTRGSAIEYQQLLAELHSLQKALHHLDNIPTRSGQALKTLDSIKFAAASCRQPLEDFLKRIRKYHLSLGGEGSGFLVPSHSQSQNPPDGAGKGKTKYITTGKTRAVARKIQWQFGMKSEVQKLQNYLSIHIGTINDLLAVYGLETIKLDADASRGSHETLVDLIKSAQQTLNSVSGDVNAQTAITKIASNTVEKLLGIITEWTMPLNVISGMVSKIWYVQRIRI
jgi:hypothetical protein